MNDGLSIVNILNDKLPLRSSEDITNLLNTECIIRLLLNIKL